MSSLDSQKICQLIKSVSRDNRRIRPNGTAVEVVNVTGAAIRLIVPVVSKETVPVASQYGAVFAKSRAAGFAIAVYDESL
jgi:hypothetical protein